jgi:hypothetical protein
MSIVIIARRIWWSQVCALLAGGLDVLGGVVGSGVEVGALGLVPALNPLGAVLKALLIVSRRN